MIRRTYSQEVRLELDGLGQVWQGRFGFSHSQEHGGSLVVRQVILRVSLCKTSRTRHFLVCTQRHDVVASTEGGRHYWKRHGVKMSAQQ